VAHRRRDAMLFEYIAEVLTRVLAAVIAMEDQPRFLAGIAPELGSQRLSPRVHGTAP